MIRWRNLWRQFILAPGTRRIRLLLSLWQVWLMWGSGLGVLVATRYTDDWRWHVGAFAIGFVVAWGSHELLFQAFAEKVVGVVEPDQHPYETVMVMGGHPHYVPTIERYWGPFGSDPKNEQVG